MEQCCRSSWVCSVMAPLTYEQWLASAAQLCSCTQPRSLNLGQGKAGWTSHQPYTQTPNKSSNVMSEISTVSKGVRCFLIPYWLSQQAQPIIGYLPCLYSICVTSQWTCPGSEDSWVVSFLNVLNWVLLVPMGTGGIHTGNLNAPHVRWLHDGMLCREAVLCLRELCPWPVVIINRLDLYDNTVRLFPSTGHYKINTLPHASVRVYFHYKDDKAVIVLLNIYYSKIRLLLV